MVLAALSHGLLTYTDHLQPMVFVHGIKSLQTEDPGTGLPPRSYRESVGVTDQTRNVRHYVFSNFPTQVALAFVLLF